MNLNLLSCIKKYLCRSALLSIPVSGWQSEAVEEAAQILGNMSSVALVRKQHAQTLAYIELLQTVVEGTSCMRWAKQCKQTVAFNNYYEVRQSLKNMKNGNRSV